MAQSNREKLIASAQAHTRAPRPERLLQERRPSYRTMGLSLYTQDADWVDGLVRTLKSHGLTKANRSFVLQQLLRDNQTVLEGKSAEEILEFFKRMRLAKDDLSRLAK